MEYLSDLTGWFASFKVNDKPESRAGTQSQIFLSNPDGLLCFPTNCPSDFVDFICIRYLLFPVGNNTPQN
jgi:hypothetical protein